MADSMMHILSRIIQALAALVVVLTLFFSYYAIPGRTTLSPVQMNAGSGYEFIANLPERHFFNLLETPADNLGNDAVSTLKLFENGTELGPPHTPHATVRSFGKGVFSHWGGEIRFSSTDGSDPRTNGRTYTARYPLYPGRLIWYLAALSAVIGVVCFIIDALSAAKGFSIREYKPTVLQFFFPRSLVKLAGLCILYTLAMILILAAITVRNESGDAKINFEYKVF